MTAPQSHEPQHPRRDVELCEQCQLTGKCRVGADDLRILADRSVAGRIVVPDDALGRQVAHGGWTAWVFDEYLGYAAAALGGWAVTSSLTINYRRPVPIGALIVVTASGVPLEQRRRRMHGEMRLDESGEVLATADGVWVELADANGHYRRAAAGLSRR